MAIALDRSKIGTPDEKSKTAFNEVHEVGSKIVHSGLYKCKNCGREIASNKHEGTLPPHYKNDECKKAQWQLFVYAQG